MCDDCQAAAAWLGRTDILDDNGGTTVFQVAPNRVTFEREHLGLLRLSPKGLYRWYATCCRTPMGNTLGPRIPFFGVHRAFIAECDDLPTILGPIRARIQGRYGHGELPPGAHARASVGFILRSMRLIGGFWLRGGARPSPVFDDRGQPYVKATIPPLDEKKALYR